MIEKRPDNPPEDRGDIFKRLLPWKKIERAMWKFVDGVEGREESAHLDSEKETDENE